MPPASLLPLLENGVPEGQPPLHRLISSLFLYGVTAMVLANTAILDNTPDEPTFLNAARRGAAVFATPTRMSEGNRSGKTGPAPSEAAFQTSLLDYAAFVLDQEAEYCQQ